MNCKPSCRTNEDIMFRTFILIGVCFILLVLLVGYEELWLLPNNAASIETVKIMASCLFRCDEE